MGCGGTEPPASTATTSPDKTTPDKPSLTDADKAQIEIQKVCLVAGEPLGSMGTPLKVNVSGRDVFLCCEGCREAVLKNPEKYLAKLDEKGAIKAEAAAAPAAGAPAASETKAP